MKFPVVCVLDDIRSALNVGAIFRTSDGAGVTKLFLTGITPYPPHNRIPKTALGAIDMVEWEYNKDTLEVVNKLIKDGYTIFSVELTDTAKNYTSVEYPEKSAFIFGNEIAGVKEELVKLSKETVYIPMYGDKESLNVATTYGIMVYEYARQHEMKN